MDRNLKRKRRAQVSKSRKLGKVLLASLAGQLLLGTPIHASTLDQLNAQEQKKTEEIQALQGDISTMLMSINERKSELDSLNLEVAEIETQQEKTLEEIDKQKEVIAARKNQLKERLVALQTSPSSDNRILMLLKSDNFSDFLAKFILIGQLQAADNERIELAIEEEKKMIALENRLAQEVADGKAKAELARIETDSLHTELEELQTVLSNNELVLQEILTDKTTEENRLAEVARQEKEAAEKAEADRIAAEEAAKQAEIHAQEEAERAVLAAQAEAEERARAEEAAAKESVNKTPVQTTNPTEKEDTIAETPTPSTDGKTLTVVTTAYSRNEPNLTNFTRTGIDLRVNPMVIAVDPSVIPLGSIVEVPGYGIAIAGDTGSAIIGNKIDLHMEDLQACYDFGRQTLTIKILN